MDSKQTRATTIIGLMTGTSLDGIDYCCVRFSDQSIEVLDAAFAPFDMQLKNRLRQLRDNASSLSLSVCYSLSQQLARLCADLIERQLQQANAHDIVVDAIGYQGQTIHHNPSGRAPYSFQINDPELLNALTAIPVISGFRQSDIANGGQGAPLTPIFHQHFLNDENESRAILNIGGISNVTILSHSTSYPTRAFDCGPGNTLLDEWCRTKFGITYDKDGEQARRGTANSDLLHDMLEDPYFKKLPPKSTGQEYFNSDWLTKFVVSYPNLTRQDILATLTEFTAVSSVLACTQYCPNITRLILCGGGGKNSYLVSRITEVAKPIIIESSDQHGISGDYLEAIAFAFFADCRLRNLPLDLSFATGARDKILLGTVCDIYGSLSLAKS